MQFKVCVAAAATAAAVVSGANVFNGPHSSLQPNEVLIATVQQRVPTSDPNIVLAVVDRSAAKSSNNGRKRRGSQRTEVITKAPLGEKWRNFEFKGEGEEALQSFKFRLDEPSTLDVTDYKCSGDSFVVYDKDDSTPILETLPVAFDNCATFTETAEEAWSSPNWSHRREILSAGSHHLHIFAKVSPFGYGDAALRINPIEMCSKSRSGYQVIETVLPFRLAASACQEFGLELAAVVEDDLHDVLKLTHDCLDEDAYAFIASYNGNNEEAKPMYVHTGESRGDGQVILRDAGVPMYSVVCKEPAKKKRSSRK